jgi:hypothetical protein
MTHHHTNYRERGLPDCECPAGCGGRPELYKRLAPAYPTVAPGSARPPAVSYEPRERGELVYDTLNRRVGVFMARLGKAVYLRPERGGEEWEVSPQWLAKP